MLFAIIAPVNCEAALTNKAPWTQTAVPDDAATTRPFVIFKVPFPAILPLTDTFVLKVAAPETTIFPSTVTLPSTVRLVKLSWLIS